MVNVAWYRTFKAIYSTGALTGAAQTLFISQPGVSLHLSSLESFVVYTLFDRTARKIGPAIIPDFLCRKEVESGLVKQLWAGNKEVTKTLYFGAKKRPCTKADQCH